MIPVIILFVFAMMFFLVGPFGSFPLNDDWIYTLAALKTSENLHFAVPGPQLVWAVPQTIFSAIWIRFFGFSFFYLRILTFLVAAAGLFAFDRLLLLHNVSRQTRLLAGLCLIGFFPFLPLSAGFMSDIYFFVFWLYACLLFEIAFKTGQNKAWLAGSLLIMLCSLERQFGIILAAAVLIYSFISKSTSLRKVILVVIVPVVIFGAMTVIWNRFPLAWKVSLIQSPDIQQRIGNLFCISLYLGMGILPFVMASCSWKMKGIQIGSLILFFIFVFGTLFIAPWNFRDGISGGMMPFFGNLLSRYGIFMQNEALHGFREILFGEWFWKLYTLLSILGAVFVALKLWRPQANFIKKMSLTGLASLLYLTVIVIARNPLFDRYLLPVFAGLLLYLAESLPAPALRMNRVLSVVAAFCLIFFSTMVTQDYFRWNEAKWQAAGWAAAQGYPVLSVDGGYEWTGWHRYSHPDSGKNNDPEPVIISFSELEGLMTLKAFPYESWIRKGSVFCLLRHE